MSWRPRRHACVVAAYRDRYQIDDDAPLGPAPRTATQKIAPRYDWCQRLCLREKSPSHGALSMSEGDNDLCAIT